MYTGQSSYNYVGMKNAYKDKLKYILWWSLLVMVAYGHLMIEAEQRVISLGDHCQVAAFLKRAGLRKLAYPFDWMITNDFEGFLKVLEENFAHFFNPEMLFRHEYFIQNTYYKVFFFHDFPTLFPGNQRPQQIANIDSMTGAGPVVVDFLKYLPQVKQKYSRRIKRFNAALRSRDHIIFMRSNMIPSEAQRLVAFFKEKYPELNFTLVVLYDRSRGVFSDDDWNIPQVRAFFMHDRVESHIFKWWADQYWHEAFTQLGLIPKDFVFQAFVIR